MQKYTHFVGHFNNHCSARVLPTLTDGGGPWVYLKPLDATIGCTLAPITTIGHAEAVLFVVF
jgi:hypothetical protein